MDKRKRRREQLRLVGRRWRSEEGYERLLVVLEEGGEGSRSRQRRKAGREMTALIPSYAS